MTLRNEKYNTLCPGKGRFKYYGLVAWPDDALGWLRILATIMLLAGTLGILKNTLFFWYTILKPLRLPSIEWCWIMIALSVGFHLFCAIRFFYVRNKSCVANVYDRSVVPQQWRSF
jgi:hypothetical protein